MATELRPPLTQLRFSVV